MFKKIKDLLVPIIITGIAILLCVWYVSIADGHEDAVWKHAASTGRIVQQEGCGYGITVLGRPDGTVGAALLAGGQLHLIRDIHDIKTCEELFNYFLEEGE